MDHVITERLAKFSYYSSKPLGKLKIMCSNNYCDVAHFENYEGVVMIGFGEEEGFEHSKDALAFDKKDLPAVIEFLQSCVE